MIVADLLLTVAIALLGYIIKLQFTNAKEIAKIKQEIKDKLH